MRFVKASERLPENNAEVFIRYTDGEKVIKMLGWYRDNDCTCCGKHFGAPFFHFESKFFHLIEWLDESLPASLEQEAEEIYSATYPSDAYETLSLNDIARIQQQAHITAARQYTGEVEKYMKEIATWKELAHKYVDRIKELEQAVELYRKGISNYDL